MGLKLNHGKLQTCNQHKRLERLQGDCSGILGFLCATVVKRGQQPWPCASPARACSVVDARWRTRGWNLQLCDAPIMHARRGIPDLAFHPYDAFTMHQVNVTQAVLEAPARGNLG